MKFSTQLLNNLSIAGVSYLTLFGFIKYVTEDNFFYFFASMCGFTVLQLHLEWYIEYKIKEAKG